MYGGDIYLLGGSHFFMKDQTTGNAEEVGAGGAQDDNGEINAANNAAKFS